MTDAELIAWCEDKFRVWKYYPAIKSTDGEMVKAIAARLSATLESVGEEYYDIHPGHGNLADTDDYYGDG